MISIVISTRPEWACKILNGEKTIEVRKGLALYNALKRAEERGEEVEFLMYVTKEKPLIRLESLLGGKIKYDVDLKRNRNAYSETLDGKVVARFKAKKVEKIYLGIANSIEDDVYCFRTDSLDHWHLNEATCLDEEQLEGYIKEGTGCALHISNLEPLDKPKDLADYGLKRAPQSWCYAKEAKQ